MDYILRSAEREITKALQRDKSVLLLGPRQTGNTTLLNRLGGNIMISFVRPEVRQRYEASPSLLAGEVEAFREKNPAIQKPLVLIDEIQKVPQVLDVIQDLIDRQVANFALRAE